MIECELNGKKGYLTVINWDKRQFPSDSSTDRTRKWRARERHSDGTELDKDKDIDLKEPAPPASPAPLASLEKELGKYINEMKWGEAQAFAGAMLKKKEHPGAILDALMQITISQPEDPWAYGMTIVKTRSPTHRAKDHHRHSQEQYGKNNHH
jgi:hypothetical protein